MRFKFLSVVFIVSFKEVAVLLIKTVFTIWNSVAALLKWNAFTV
jgi:hypothetical protein